MLKFQAIDLRRGVLGVGGSVAAVFGQAERVVQIEFGPDLEECPADLAIEQFVNRADILSRVLFVLVLSEAESGLNQTA